MKAGYSIFDCLVGGNIAHPHPQLQTHSDNKTLIQSIIRDLQHLLNTRKTIITGSGDVDGTILNYGMMDLTDFNPESNLDKERLLQTLTQLIYAHEPRLKDIKISYQESDICINQIVLLIEAKLDIGIDWVAVSFKSILNPTSEQFFIKDNGYE